ncbi:MAG: hypothetical protein ACYTG5_18760 [Planctomycetota bacterium]
MQIGYQPFLLGTPFAEGPLTMNLLTKLSLLTALPLLAGCFSLRMGDNTRDEDKFFEIDGLASAYGNIVSFDEYDGPNYGIDILSNLGDGEVAAVDLGPIFGVGVGLAGFRLRIWPIDFGIGVLAYDPEDANHINKSSARERRARAKRNKERREEEQRQRSEDEMAPEPGAEFTEAKTGEEQAGEQKAAEKKTDAQK